MVTGCLLCLAHPGLGLALWVVICRSIIIKLLLLNYFWFCYFYFLKREVTQTGPLVPGAFISDFCAQGDMGDQLRKDTSQNNSVCVSPFRT